MSIWFDGYTWAYEYDPDRRYTAFERDAKEECVRRLNEEERLERRRRAKEEEAIQQRSRRKLCETILRDIQKLTLHLQEENAKVVTELKLEAQRRAEEDKMFGVGILVVEPAKEPIVEIQYDIDEFNEELAEEIAVEEEVVCMHVDMTEIPSIPCDVEIDEVKVESIDPPLISAVTNLSLQVPIHSEVLQVDRVMTLVHAVEVKDTNSTVLLVHLKGLQAMHVSHDPFSLHCAPLVFVLADLYALDIPLYKRMMTAMFTSSLFRDVISYVGLLWYVWPKFVFDPGGFEDEASRRRGE